MLAHFFLPTVNSQDTKWKLKVLSYQCKALKKDACGRLTVSTFAYYRVTEVFSLLMWLKNAQTWTRWKRLHIWGPHKNKANLTNHGELGTLPFIQPRNQRQRTARQENASDGVWWARENRRQSVWTKQGTENRDIRSSGTSRLQLLIWYTMRISENTSKYKSYISQCV